jgi:hypothetical protein
MALNFATIQLTSVGLKLLFVYNRAKNWILSAWNAFTWGIRSWWSRLWISFIYAYQSLIIHLIGYYSLIVAHGFVLDAFWWGIVVLLVEDKSNNINNISNYRPITLTPVISKVLEALLMRICEGNLATSDLIFNSVSRKTMDVVM